MKYTDLPNKHDKVTGWGEKLEEEVKKNKKVIERIKYIESELAAKDRLDGYVISGLEEELKKLKNVANN